MEFMRGRGVPLRIERIYYVNPILITPSRGISSTHSDDESFEGTLNPENAPRRRRLGFRFYPENVCLPYIRGTLSALGN